MRLGLFRASMINSRFYENSVCDPVVFAVYPHFKSLKAEPVDGWRVPCPRAFTTETNTQQSTTQNQWTLTSLLDPNDYFSPNKGNATIFEVTMARRPSMYVDVKTSRTHKILLFPVAIRLTLIRKNGPERPKEWRQGDSLKNHYNIINVWVHWRKTATFFFFFHLINPIFQAQMSNVLFSANNLLCLQRFLSKFISGTVQYCGSLKNILHFNHVKMSDFK